MTVLAGKRSPDDRGCSAVPMETETGLAYTGAEGSPVQGDSADPVALLDCPGPPAPVGPGSARRRALGAARGTGTRAPLPVTACLVPRQDPARQQRSRWLLLFGVVAAVCAGVVVFGLAVGGMAAGTGADVPNRTGLVTVGHGETLWDLARVHAPNSDPREVIDRIRDLNDLEASSVPEGDVLTVPMQSAYRVDGSDRSTTELRR